MSVFQKKKYYPGWKSNPGPITPEFFATQCILPFAGQHVTTLVETFNYFLFHAWIQMNGVRYL